jgi:signal transduction histidine kinase
MRARLQLNALVAIAVVLTSILIFDASVSLRELVLPAIIATVVMIAISSFTASRLSESIENLSEVARSLAAGDMSARAPLTGPGELGELGTAMGRLSEYLASSTAALRHEDALLASVIEALDEGVVYVNAQRQVIRLNSAARDILGLKRPTPFSGDLLPRTNELQRALDAALKGSVTDQLEATIGARTLSLSARPLNLGGGVVLALFDLTRIRRLETVRRDFVANVSHELRTPLTVISGFAETLADDDPPVETRRQFAATIRTHAERMQRIVDDLLDLSRLESGKWEPQLEDVDPHAAVLDVAATYRAIAEAKGLRLAVESAPTEFHIFADRTAIRQVLSNLADNALRYTERGTVTLFCKPERSGAWLGVRDTGAGIAPEHLGRIFERFYRADPGRARNNGGTGLGLSIVKHLVDAHGGNVKAESELGRGTSIAAFFPSR